MERGVFLLTELSTSQPDCNRHCIASSSRSTILVCSELTTTGIEVAMGINPKRKEAATRSFSQASATERCMCQPLSSLQTVPLARQEEDETVYEHVVPATAVLNTKLRTLLQTVFPRSTPLSLLLLHVSQLEYTHVAPQAGVHKCRRYHASPEVLEQILVNVRRAIRQEDSLLVHEGTGAVLLFPNVDQHGASAIL